jgi:hypothetical protein
MRVFMHIYTAIQIITKIQTERRSQSSCCFSFLSSILSMSCLSALLYLLNCILLCLSYFDFHVLDYCECNDML